MYFATVYQISWRAAFVVDVGVEMGVIKIRVGNVNCEIVGKPNGGYYILLFIGKFQNVQI